jgi:putative tributyrin esterase
MALCEIRWLSTVLDKQVNTSIILPEAGTPPFPVYYLLHGLTDDHTAWRRKARIEIHAAPYPLIVVMPDGFRGFFTNNTVGPAYAKYAGEELVTMIERNFPARKDAASRCIGGLSMGGYGALRLALGYAGNYASVNSHSGALMNGSRTMSPDRFPDAPQIFGPSPSGSDHDLILLARRAQSAGKLPKIRLDCGTEDFLLADNRQYHQTLTDLKIPHEYEEYPGAHDWEYWDNHIREALEFHAGVLGISKI